MRSVGWPTSSADPPYQSADLVSNSTLSVVSRRESRSDGQGLPVSSRVLTPGSLTLVDSTPVGQPTIENVGRRRAPHQSGVTPSQDAPEPRATFGAGRPSPQRPHDRRLRASLTPVAEPFAGGEHVGAGVGLVGVHGEIEPGRVVAGLDIGDAVLGLQPVDERAVAGGGNGRSAPGSDRPGVPARPTPPPASRARPRPPPGSARTRPCAPSRWPRSGAGCVGWPGQCVVRATHL